MALRSLLLTAQAALTVAATLKEAEDLGTPSIPTPVYPSVNFELLDVKHVILQQDGVEPVGNSSWRSLSQTFLITAPPSRLLQPRVNASFGPLTVDAPVPQDQLLSGPKILAVLLARQVRSSSPVLRILFHMPADGSVDQEKSAPGDPQRRRISRAQCVTAYAFWETREVRGSCLLTPDGFCVAQLRPEPAWFGSASRSDSSSGETSRTEGARSLERNLVEVYFQSRRDPTGQCAPQDSLQRVGVGRGRDSKASGTPMKRLGSVSLVRSPPGNPTFYRLKLGGAMVIQTSSKPLKAGDVATFNIFFSSTSTVQNFSLRASVKAGRLSFRGVRPSDSTLWDVQVEPRAESSPSSVSVVCQRKGVATAKRGLLEVLQLDLLLEDEVLLPESHSVVWRLELLGNVKEGSMKIYSSQRDFVGLAPLIMETDMLNTAVLTGQKVSLPVRTLAVEADGSLHDVTNFTGCSSARETVLKVSQRCDYVFVDGTEASGHSSVTLNFSYSFLSAQLEMRVWFPHLPLRLHLSDPVLSPIKGWRVPVSAASRRTTWDSDEEEEMRKGRGCMLQYQHSLLRVMTPFIARTSGEAEPVDYFLGPDWKVDVTKLVEPSLRVVDPDVAQLLEGGVLQGRSVGTTTVQVLSPLSPSRVLAQVPVQVLDERVSMMTLGVQLVSGLSLSLQLNPAGAGTLGATAATRETITQLQQEAVVSCWLRFSDGAVTPLALFDRSSYQLTVSTPDEGVAMVRRTASSTFVVARGDGGEGGGHRGALVRVELRICEECQKSKRKSRLVVGSTPLKVDLQGGIRGVRTEGGSSAAVGRLKSTVTPRRSDKPRGAGLGSSTPSSSSTSFSSTFFASTSSSTISTTSSSTSSSSTSSFRTSSSLSTTSSTTTSTTTTSSTPLIVLPPPRSEATRRPPPTSDLITTFRALGDLEMGVFALVGVCCAALLAFLLNCASYSLRMNKTPTQVAPPSRLAPNTKNHKHEWVWLGGHRGGGAPAPPAAPPSQWCPPEASSTAAAAAAAPERTATLGRSRSSSSQQQQHQPKGVEPTLLAPPPPPAGRAHQLHSPTSKRNQVQFTTFTTLDVKHLTALRNNGVETGSLGPPTPLVPPLPDRPWPVVTPVGNPQ